MFLKMRLRWGLVPSPPFLAGYSMAITRAYRGLTLPHGHHLPSYGEMPVCASELPAWLLRLS